MELLSGMHNWRTKTFKVTTIMSAWRDAGLVPFNPQRVLSKIVPPAPITLPPAYAAHFQYELNVTPESAGGLTALANFLQEPPSPCPSERYDEAKFRFIRASLTIASSAASTHRQLMRTAAAEKVRKQQKKDSRKSLQAGGTMYV